MKNELCQGNMPTLVHMSPGGTERYPHFLGEILVIPDPDTP